MSTGTFRKAALAAAFFASLSACELATNAGIEIELGSQTLQVTQGQTGTVTVTVTRTDFDGEITLAATGLPTGVTGQFSPPTLAGDATTSTLTLTATNVATPGAAQITIEASASGIDLVSATLSLTVNVAGGYTLSASPGSVTVQQGGTGTSAVTITRTGGFAQDVTFSASGLPSGVTAAFNPAAASGTSTTVTFTAAANATPATATVTITGTSPGLANQTTTVSVTVSPPPSISVSTAASLSVGQGASNTLTVTLTRTNYTGDVALAASGLPTGVTASFSPATLSGATTTSTLTIAANATATPGNATVTVTGSGTGVTNATATFTLTVNVTGSYTLSAAPASLTLAQGSNVSSTITLTKSGGFAQNVSLAASGLPTGVTAAFNPSSVSGTSSTLTLTAASNATTGNATVTVTGTTPGLSNQTTTIALNVLSPTSTQQLSIDFCSGENIVWFAIKNEGGTWTRVLPDANNTVTAQVTSRFGVAIIDDESNGGPTAYRGEVHYITFNEVAPLNGVTCVDEGGTKTLNGTVAGLSATRPFAQIGMTFNQTFVSFPNTSFSLMGLPNGALDLVSARFTDQPGQIPDKFIIRRGINQTSGTSISTLDFDAGEAITPASQMLTVTGTVGGEELSAFASFNTNSTSTTAVQTRGSIWGMSLSSTSATMQLVPAASTQTGDVHELGVFSSSSATGKSRGFFSYFRNPSNQTAALGAAINTPTITDLAAATYKQYRIELASQAEYGANLFVDISQPAREWNMSITAAYLGSTPTTWDLSIPDFTAVSGWNNAYGLQSGVTTDFQIAAIGSGASAINDIGADGTSYKMATYETSTTSTLSTPMFQRSSPRLNSTPWLKSAAPKLVRR